MDLAMEIGKTSTSSNMFVGVRWMTDHKDGVLRVIARNRREILAATARKAEFGGVVLESKYPCSRMRDKISLGTKSKGHDKSALRWTSSSLSNRISSAALFSPEVGRHFAVVLTERVSPEY